MDSFRPEFESQDMSLVEVCWDDPDADWSSFDLALIGTAWDYWDRKDLFLETLDKIESITTLCNSASIVRWNTNKKYLQALESRGARLIPTQWIQDPTREAIEQAFDSLCCDDMVVKRQVGAGADGQFRVKRGQEIPPMNKPMMAQPFLYSIETEGELSFIYIDGQFSHALLKRAASGDYRIQSTYGGTEEAVLPEPEDLTSAAAILNSLDVMPLYARVDMIRSESGSLLLMELELIEPYLYPVEGPALGRRMAEAVAKRLE